MTGSDIKQTGVAITLDKERHLAFDLNALCDLEEKFGDISKAMDSIAKNPKMKDIRYILFLALRHEDENLTEIAVGKLITLMNIGDVSDALGKAMSDSLPEPNENTKN